MMLLLNLLLKEGDFFSIGRHLRRRHGSQLNAHGNVTEGQKNGSGNVMKPLFDNVSFKGKQGEIHGQQESSSSETKDEN